MDFMHRAAAWLAGGVVFAASCASVLAAAACLPERAILQHALLAMQSPAAAVACALPPPRPPTHTPQTRHRYKAYACAGPGPANAHKLSPTPEPSPTPAAPATAPQIEDAGLNPGRAVPPWQGRGQHLSLSAGSNPQQPSACADADLRAAVDHRANLPFAVELNSDEPQVCCLHNPPPPETTRPCPDLLYDRSGLPARDPQHRAEHVRRGCPLGRGTERGWASTTLHDENVWQNDSPSYNTESYDRAASRATAQV